MAYWINSQNAGFFSNSRSRFWDMYGYFRTTCKIRKWVLNEYSTHLAPLCPCTYVHLSILSCCHRWGELHWMLTHKTKNCHKSVCSLLKLRAPSLMAENNFDWQLYTNTTKIGICISALMMHTEVVSNLVYLTYSYLIIIKNIYFAQ